MWGMALSTADGVITPALPKPYSAGREPGRTVVGPHDRRQRTQLAPGRAALRHEERESHGRAWRSLDRFDGRLVACGPGFYRIATNVCLDLLAQRARRARPIESGPAGTVEDRSRSCRRLREQRAAARACHLGSRDVANAVHASLYALAARAGRDPQVASRAGIGFHRGPGLRLTVLRPVSAGRSGGGYQPWASSFSSCQATASRAGTRSWIRRRCFPMFARDAPHRPFFRASPDASLLRYRQIYGRSVRTLLQQQGGSGRDGEEGHRPPAASMQAIRRITASCMAGASTSRGHHWEQVDVSRNEFQPVMRSPDSSRR